MEIRIAQEEDTPVILSTLVEAFANDHLLTWFVRPGARKMAALRTFFEFMLGGEAREAQWIHIADGGRAVAFWVRWDQVDPKDPKYGEIEKIRRAFQFSGLLRLARTAKADHITSQCRKTMEARSGTADLAYLRFLACHPDHQGRGLGSALLKQGLINCETLGIPGYLESVTARNVAFYENRGFEVEREFGYGSDGIVRGMLYRPGQQSVTAQAYIG
jgi:predicted N-acetyltransferase YhbS